MIDEIDEDPIFEIQNNVSKIDAEGARYAKMAGFANMPCAGLRQDQAELLLISYLRSTGTTRPEIIACELIDKFEYLTDIFDAPLQILRQSGLTNERALSGILQYRLLRDAIAKEDLERDKAYITPASLSKFLLTGRRPANSQIRILFLNRDSKLKKDIVRDLSTQSFGKITKEICQISLHKDALFLIIARYNDSDNFTMDEVLLSIANRIRRAIKFIEGEIHHVIIVGPASIHSLSDLSIK